MEKIKSRIGKYYTDTDTVTVPSVRLKRSAFKGAGDLELFCNYSRDVGVGEDEERNKDLKGDIRFYYKAIIIAELNQENPNYVTFERESTLLNENVESGLIEDSIDSADIFESFKIDQKKDVDLDIVKKIKVFDEVIAIYTYELRAEHNIIVFLNINKYDNLLMYNILNVEYDLQGKYSDKNLAFSYIPGIIDDRRELVHSKAKLIYER